MVGTRITTVFQDHCFGISKRFSAIHHPGSRLVLSGGGVDRRVFNRTNADGTRSWGVFQLSDALLHELGGTPELALHPEWNIQTARQMWALKGDFSLWPHCDQRIVSGLPTPTA